MTSKPKRQSKAPKPDCKVWAQVGEELLSEYLNKPIDGVDGHECWLVVAPGDILSFHCQAKPGVFDEFVLSVDGIIRGCEVRRNTTVIFDKALHRAQGRGKQPGAVYRSDMVVQLRNETESRVAEGDQVLSKVGSIMIEGWRKLEEKQENGQSISFPTYDESREWYDLNRLVSPTPGYLPPFEVGFNHGEKSCGGGVGFRTRVAAAATRNTTEWKLVYKYVFNLRSAMDMHALGQTDVPVRNPKTSLFAEDPEEESEEAKNDEQDTEEDEPASDDGVEEQESAMGEEPEETTDEVQQEKKLVKPTSNHKKDKNMARVEAEANKDNAKSNSKPKAKTVEDHKESSEKTKAKPNGNTAEKSFEKPSEKPSKQPIEKSKDKPKVNSTPSVEPSTKKSSNSKDPATSSQQTSSDVDDPSDPLFVAAKVDSQMITNEAVIVEPMSKGIVSSIEGDVQNSEAGPVTLKKKALYGLKSAPASNASRIRSISGNSTSLLEQDGQEPESTDAPIIRFPATPPSTGRKRQSFSGPATVHQRLYPISSAVNVVRGASEPTYHMPSASRRVSFHNDTRSNRAVSEDSNASIEIVDPAEMRTREIQGWTFGSIGSRSQSSSIIPECGNHTTASPILGNPSPSGSVNNDAEVEEPIELKRSQEPELALHDSPSTQLRQEVAGSLRHTSVKKSSMQQLDIDNDGSSLAASFHSHRSSRLEPESFTTKRKSDESTGNGLIAESARPRKTLISPATRSAIETLHLQQEENDRLKQELEDVQLHIATLERIQELKKHNKGVQEKIAAEKARQALLEAELGH